MFKKCVLFLPLLAVAFFLCISTTEGQLFVRRGGSCQGGSCQIVTGPSVVSRPEEVPVAQPSLLPCQTEEPSSPQQPIVLAPLSGTGSKSPTGLLTPKVTHQIDPATLEALKSLLATKLQTAPVSITPTLDDATSQRISRISQVLEILLWLGSGSLGFSFLGKFGPLVAPVVSGLLSALQARLPVPPTTQGGPSSTPPSGS